MRKEEKGKYDKVMRGNLGNPSSDLVRQLLSVDVLEIHPLPSHVFQTIVKKECDTLVVVTVPGAKPFILHLEFQSTNDWRMARRMAAYDFMLYLEHNMEVVGVVIYIGTKKLSMKNEVRFGSNYYSCKMIDIRELESELFLSSNNSKETIFAILAKYEESEQELLINKILNKLQVLDDSASALEENIRKLEILSNLRSVDIQNLIIKKIETMPIIYDLRKDLRFKQGKREGKSEGRESAMKERNEAFVKYLLQNTSHTVKEIAGIVGVPLDFVINVQNNY